MPRRAKKPSRRAIAPARFSPKPGISAMPYYFDTILTYVEQASYDATSSTVAYETWNINSCFDPRTATGGHQPLEFDQFCTAQGPYYYYTVLYCDVEMTVTPGSTPTQGVVFGIIPTTTSGTIPTTDVVTLLESDRINAHRYFTPSAGYPTTLKRRFNIAKLNGIRDADVLLQADYTGNFGANPSRVMTAVTWVGSTMSTNEPTPLNVTVTLKYGVRFTNPRTSGYASLSASKPAPPSLGVSPAKSIQKQ